MSDEKITPIVEDLDQDTITEDSISETEIDDSPKKKIESVSSTSMDKRVRTTTQPVREISMTDRINVEINKLEIWINQYQFRPGLGSTMKVLIRERKNFLAFLKSLSE